MRSVTKALLMLFTTTLAGYDVWAYNHGGTEATVSAVVRDFAVDWPIGAVAVGTVIGHIFWPLGRKKEGPSGK